MIITISFQTAQFAILIIKITYINNPFYIGISQCCPNQIELGFTLFSIKKGYPTIMHISNLFGIDVHLVLVSLKYTPILMNSVDHL